VNGNFNGVQLHKITSLKIQNHTPGFTHTSFRVIEESRPDLEHVLELGTPALLILADKIIEGRIVSYKADLHFGYEITIETKK